MVRKVEKSNNLEFHGEDGGEKKMCKKQVSEERMG